MSNIDPETLLLNLHIDSDENDEKKKKTRRKKRNIHLSNKSKKLPKDEVDFKKQTINNDMKEVDNSQKSDLCVHAVPTSILKICPNEKNVMFKPNDLHQDCLNVSSVSSNSVKLPKSIISTSVRKVSLQKRTAESGRKLLKSGKSVNKSAYQNKVLPNSCKCTCDFSENKDVVSIPTLTFYNSSLNNTSADQKESSIHKITETDKNCLKCQVHNKKSVYLKTNIFEKYLTEEEVTNGLKTGNLLEGSIRINPKNFKECYITNPDLTKQDFLIDSVKDRNRSLEGDIVVFQVKPSIDWHKDGQQTAKVVFIKEKIHPRTCVGILKLMTDKNKNFALLSPNDSRLPRLKIPFADWPELFYEEPKKYEKTLFLAQIVSWYEINYACGKIIKSVGISGDLKTESEVILLENALDTSSYDSELCDSFKLFKEIPAEELAYREDFRNECIFTIDPLTAKDLDDAVSCKELPNGNLEIGVHISDVSFYLKEDHPINEIALQKATSVYLVQTVYHMLPIELCMLCSLLPGEDKLAFSVIWEMTKDGKVISYRCARTVIKSCTQLAYEHAQLLLENPDKKFSPNEFPIICNNFTIEDIHRTVNYLYRISENLRMKRIESGALRIDQPKLKFSIDYDTGDPLDYSVEENKESNRLIEEFMLLANITVGTRLYEYFPEIAFLRSHPPPHQRLMMNLQKMLENIGIHLDVSSSGNLFNSLKKYSGNDDFSKARMLVLNLLCAKPMTRAKYFCAGTSNVTDFEHYALHVPIYTHFTSPIRRYADIMVHRLLSASLNYTETPNWDLERVEYIAGICNKQKYNAKKAGEQSILMYTKKYIEKNQPLTETGIVMDVKDRSFDIIVLSMGINVRVYTNNLSPPLIVKHNKNVNEVPTITIEWPATKDCSKVVKVIDIFSMVKVQLRISNSKKIDAVLMKA